MFWWIGGAAIPVAVKGRETNMRRRGAQGQRAALPAGPALTGTAAVPATPSKTQRCSARMGAMGSEIRASRFRTCEPARRRTRGWLQRQGQHLAIPMLFLARVAVTHHAPHSAPPAAHGHIFPLPAAGADSRLGGGRAPAAGAAGGGCGCAGSGSEAGSYLRLMYQGGGGLHLRGGMEFREISDEWSSNADPTYLDDNGTSPPEPYIRPGGNPGANLKSIAHRCLPILVAVVWELTKETIDLPLSCLQGGLIRN